MSFEAILNKEKDEELAREVRADFLGCPAFRKYLINELKDEIERTRKKSTTKSSYEGENWALKQADSMGYERSIRRLIDLLK